MNKPGGGWLRPFCFLLGWIKLLAVVILWHLAGAAMKFAAMPTAEWQGYQFFSTVLTFEHVTCPYYGLYDDI
jgi:hypothetical protein